MTPASRAAATVAAITLAGLAIRLWGLGSASVWFDESYHVALVREPTVGAMLDAILRNPPSAPLFALLLRAWVGVAGHGDVAIRLPSALAGTLTIPAAAWAAHELDGRRAVGLLAALFVAVSPYALELAQEAAPYALAALLTTLAITAAWRWRRTGTNGDAVLAVLLAISAVYSHYVAGAALGVIWLLGLLPANGPRGVSRRRWLLGAAVIITAWSPWLVELAQHWLASAVPRPALYSPADLKQVAGALGQYVVGTAALLQGWRLLLLVGVVLAGILVAFGWQAGREARRRGLRVVVVTSAILFALPAAASAVTGLWLFVAHFGLLMLPSMAVVAGAGAIEAPTAFRARVADPRRIAGGLTAAAILVALVGVGLFRVAPPHGANGLRELVAELDARAASDAPVLVAPPILMPDLAQYTDRPLTGIPSDFDLRTIYASAGQPLSDDDLRRTAQVAIDSRAEVWLVVRPEGDPDGVISAMLAARYTVTSQTETGFATLLGFDLELPP